jgi:hypothetical protein
MLERLSGAPYLPHRQSLRQDLISLPKSLVSDFALSPLNQCLSVYRVRHTFLTANP